MARHMFAEWFANVLNAECEEQQTPNNFFAHALDADSEEMETPNESDHEDAASDGSSVALESVKHNFMDVAQQFM